MANPSANLRVRISADLNDIKQGLAVLRGELAKTQREAGKPLPANNPVKQLGVSAGQTAAAMRQLPAQFTDIATSIQGGMPIFTVLLQQGGQIRDSFGSVGGALRGVATGVMSMINPVTVAAAAIGGMALAWKQAADAQFEFDKALITTGNASGKTTEDLQDLVGTLDTLDGVTRGAAADAVLEVAKSGRFAGEQFDQVAAAAARMEGATGQAIDTTIDKFKDLAKDPVDALLKLNETEHFLTQTQLDRVTALEKEGREQEAVAEAVRIYSDHLDNVARQANEAMPAMSRWWRAVKDEISGATGQLGQYLNLVAEYAAQQVPQSGPVGDFFNWKLERSLLQQLTDAGRARVSGGRPQVMWQGLYENNPNGDLPAEDLREEQKEWEKLTESLDKAARKKAEINRIEELGKKLKMERAEIDKLLLAVEDKYAEKAKKTKDAKTEEEKAADALKRNYESIAEQLERQIGLYGDLNNLEKLNYEITSGNLKGLTEDRAKYLQQLATELDLYRYMDEAEDIQGKNEEDAIKGLEKRTDAMTVFADEAARNIQGFLGDSLYQTLDGRFGDIGDSFSELIKRMAAEIAASQILKGLMSTSFFSLFGSSDPYTGFASGGYTGPGAVDTPAGIVHRGEVVWSQRDVARAGGVGVVEAMRLGLRGYAAGGVVGPAGSGGRGMRVEIVNNGAPAKVGSVAQDAAPDGGQLLRIVLDAVADDLGSGGRIARVGKARFGWRDIS